jgi:hypothetical protein
MESKKRKRASTKEVKTGSKNKDKKDAPSSDDELGIEVDDKVHKFSVQQKDKGKKDESSTKDEGINGLDINTPGLMIINSKSQGGKSHLAQYTMYEKRKAFKWGIAFSNTAFNDDNLAYIPKRFKHLEYRPLILWEVMCKQAAVPKAQRPLVFVWIDDCNAQMNEHDKILYRAITQTFHYNLFILITTQNINTLPSWCRENAFQVVLFKMFTKGALESAYDSYGQDFDSVKDFKHQINNKLGDHVFAYINRHKMGQWKFMKCPAVLPKFKLKYGPEYEEEKKQKNKKGKRKKRKIN